MFSNQSAELALNAPCKSVAAVKADRLESRFLLGGCSIPDSSLNQIHVVRYHSDVNVVGLDASLNHPTGPIQHMVTSPNDRTLVLTLAERSNCVTLYKLPPAVMELSNELAMDSDTTDNYGGSMSGYSDSFRDGASHHTESSANNMNASFQSTGSTSGGAALEPRLTLDNSSSPDCVMLDMAWRGMDLDIDPNSDTAAPGDVLTLDDTGKVTQWDLSMGLPESTHFVTATKDNEDVPLMCTPRVVWDPHHGSNLAVSWGRSVRFLDLRSPSDDTVGSIARAHRYGVTDVDYNPNKPYTLATSGLDGLVHYWDTRSTRRPIMSARGGHSHYSWRVCYNPFHDQLVLSTGTDAVANLWRVSSISSAPLLTLENDASPAGEDDSESELSAPNVRVARYEASDSIYDVAWSAADAWMYMTVAYDGRLALHHVPSKEKYKILL